MNNRFDFSRKDPASIRPEARPVYLYDTGEKGLTLVVTPTGVRSFYYTGRVFGKSKRVLLGRHPDTSVKEARTAAVRVRAAISEGRDPLDLPGLAAPKSHGITLANFWSLYLDRHGRSKRKSWKQDDRDFRRVFSELLDLPITSITESRVAEIHRKIGDVAGESAANRATNLLRAVYAKAMTWRDSDGRHYAAENPAASQVVERFSESPRDRFLRADEAPAFFKALSEMESPDARHFFQLALYTAARKTNIMRMRTEQIDRAAATWTIPAAEFKKTARIAADHHVPLIPRAMHLISLRSELHGDGWIFPGRRANNKPLANANFWWDTLRVAGGVPDMRIHDLRRTTASYMAMTGASIPTIAQLLGHKLPGVTPVYARLAIASVREALEAAIDHLMEVGNVD